MREIKNPYIGRDEYNCFGCAPHNESGLQMKFFEDGDEIVSEWEPKNHLNGYKNILHGGIQATLMDELASWYIFVKLKTGGVTSKMEVKYKKPVFTDKGNLKLRAKLNAMKRNVADIEVKLFDANGKLCSQSNVFYFTFDKEKAKEKLDFPDSEKSF